MYESDRYKVFINLFKRHFHFLIDELDFEITDEEKSSDYARLEYRSEKVFLISFYNPPDFSLDFYFGRIGIDEKSSESYFSSGDLLYLCDHTKWTDYKGFMAYEVSNLKACIPELADLLKNCGYSCLIGQSTAYEEIIFKRNKHFNEWTKKEGLSDARVKAKNAWKNREYKMVCDLLSPYESVLKPSEKRLLEMAARKTR